MSFLQRAMSTRYTSEPSLVAAHVSFVKFDYDSALMEISEVFDVPHDEIEVLEVSAYERIFALWFTRGESAAGHQSPARIKAIIQRIEGLAAVRQCILQQDSIYFVNSAEECIEVKCSNKEDLPRFKGINVGNDTLKLYAGMNYDAWCFMCYDTQNPFTRFSCRTAQRYWRRSRAKDGSWVCTVNPEEKVRKGWQQFTTLSDVLSEFGPPRQYFMLVPKAFDNTYPYLLHADGKSIADPDANQPPAFVYKMVSSPLEETMDVCEEKGHGSEFGSESSLSSDDIWVAQMESQRRHQPKRRQSISAGFRSLW